jgi:uncharacterized protein YjdB/alpha-tubulin suppressor-like RCC1 family protein
VAPPEKVLYAGDTLQLEAVIRDPRGGVLRDRSVAWKSESPATATVSAAGLVTAVAEGSAKVTATSEGQSGAASVKVVPAPVASLTVAPLPDMVVGDTAQLKVALADARGHALSGRTVAWSSSDSKVAAVTPAGLVTAVAPGSAALAAESEGKRGALNVTIKPAPVASVTIDPPPEVTTGEAAQLAVRLKDPRGNPLSGRAVAWTSDSPKVATVSPTGMVNGLESGTAKVTAASEGKSWTVTVTVVPVPVAKVVIAGAPESLFVGGTAKLTATAQDAKGKPLPGRDIAWSSSDPKVIGFGKDGTLTAKAEGIAKIKASCEGRQAEVAIKATLPAPAPAPSRPSATMAEAATLVMPAAPAPAEPPKPLEEKREPRKTAARPVESDAPVPATRSKALVGIVIGVLVAGGSWLLFRGGSSAALGPSPVTVAPAPAGVASVVVNAPEGSVTVGRTLQFTALVRDASGTELSGHALTWSTSDSSVADVSPNGAVTARKPGSATITAASEGQTASAPLTVVAPEGHEPAPVAVASILMGPNPPALEVGTTTILKATPRDDRGKPLDDRAVVWATSDPAVATVSSSGVVTAVAPGSSMITASSETRSAQIKVTVNTPKPTPPPPPAVAVGSIAVASKSPAMQVGQTSQLTLTVLDAHKKPMADPGVEWTSSDPKVVIVSANGFVTAEAEGSAVVTASFQGKSATQKITVSPAPEAHVPVAAVALTPQTRALKVGETTTWTAAAQDAKGKPLADRSILWTSSNPQVATVSPSGLITAVGPGTAEITATTENKTVSNSITIAGAAPPVAAAPSLLPRKAVAAGAAFTCGITSSGAAVCWGGDHEGLDAVAGVTGITGLSLGASHACGLGAGGKAYCWGTNKSGQLGDGTVTDHSDATPVAGDLTFSMVSAGSQHTCGIVGTKAYCWGKNDKGQLGDGTTTDRRKPVAVRSNEQFTRVSAGGGHSCALNAAGKAFCWGDGWSGAVGYGDLGSQPEPLSVKTDQKFTRIATGGDHSCALSGAGKIYCWGGNSSGQVGDGSTNDRTSPVPVSTTVGFDDLTAGGANTCALAGGAAYCWGDNKFGQIGDGSKNSRNKPTPVSGGLSFSMVSVGSGYVCGVTGSGDPECWGKNDKGQLGDRSAASRGAPGPVTAP